MGSGNSSDPQSMKTRIEKPLIVPRSHIISLTFEFVMDIIIILVVGLEALRARLGDCVLWVFWRLMKKMRSNNIFWELLWKKKTYEVKKSQFEKNINWPHDLGKEQLGEPRERDLSGKFSLARDSHLE